MKQHFGQIFLGVCLVVAALIFTHPLKRQSHHYEWRWDATSDTLLVLLDSDTGEIFGLRTNGQWKALPPPPLPARH